jgi:hypothetical protein
VNLIMDQRHLYGGATVEGVEARWRRMIESGNAARADRQLPLLSLMETGKTVRAYVNHGRWVADCECGGGMGVWSENRRAACMDCGRVYGVEWPDPDIRRLAEEALLVRAKLANRNWDPASETVERLQTENVLLEGAF